MSSGSGKAPIFGSGASSGVGARAPTFGSPVSLSKEGSLRVALNERAAGQTMKEVMQGIVNYNPNSPQGSMFASHPEPKHPMATTAGTLDVQQFNYNRLITEFMKLYEKKDKSDIEKQRMKTLAVGMQQQKAMFPGIQAHSLDAIVAIAGTITGGRRKSKPSRKGTKNQKKTKRKGTKKH